ncbi:MULTISPECIES: siderophore-interacting protein [Microbacterium]|jgi:NADPH-dependent ferric siderophore reductase|uniref:siderophore-interacting protein n=1 Tax=Microbacterium TaxID=33882 RepID=UPI001D1782F5|nr:siderophore-interacting protein [Microbacterium testaceum]MCC4247380.1 siderophore-interacting protein [Microbacterium testaceum]
MARSNAAHTRITPARRDLLTVRVLRRERVSPSFARVTLGGDDLRAFEPLGRDQWFRLFLPVADGSLTRLPQKLDSLAYLRYLAISKTERPVLRNYSVAGYRAEGPEGPELDVDFVLHGSEGEATAGPAATWAQTCTRGDAVAIFDEGVLFSASPAPDDRIALVGDETALPAVAGILAWLPALTQGSAVIGVPDAGDIRALVAPPGVDVRWVVRDPGSIEGGTDLLRAATEAGIPPTYGWVAGEQSLVTAMRRHWVRLGVSKKAVSFTGYWRAPRAH